MTEPTSKGVIKRGGLTNDQFIECSVPGCLITASFPIKGAPKPGDVVLNMARRRGWYIEGDGRKVCECPIHKEPKMQKTKLPAADKTLMPLSESLKLPSADARAQRRKVFYELDAAYQNGRYRDGESDEAIALRLIVSVGMVAQLREENFGPIEDPRITALEREIAALATRIEGVELAGLAALEHAEKMAKQFRGDMQDLQERLVALKGATA